MKKGKKPDLEKFDPIIHEDHSKPVTRRDFIARGMMEAGGMLLVPSLLQTILSPKMAFAETACPTAAANQLLPFVTLDCGGGANLAHAFLPRQANGQLLSSYNRMGIPNNQLANLNPDTTFGVPMNPGTGAGVSNIYSGIMEATTAATRANTRAGVICNASQNDTANNPLSPMHLLAAAGYAGDLIPNYVGNSGRNSGAKSRVATPAIGGSYTPLRVQNPSDISGAVSIGGALANELSDAQRASVIKAVSRLSQAQLAKLKGMNQAEQHENLVRCGYIKNEEFSQDFSATVDPQNNADASAVYLNNQPNLRNEGNTQRLRRASIVYNVLQGTAGAGAIEIGNCDYHNRGRTQTDDKDREIGLNIGRCLELARRLNKPVMIGVISDGGISCNENSPNFQSDSRAKSLAVVFYYNPAGAPTLKLSGQLGNYTNNQGVNTSLPIGASPELVAQTLAANWMSLNGKAGDIARILGANSDVTKNLSKYLLF